jgi:hypothetical protein
VFFLAVFCFTASIVGYAIVSSFSSRDPRGTPGEKVALLKVIRWRRKAGVPRPDSPSSGRLVAVAVIGLSPMWILLLPTVAVFSVLPVAGLLDFDRRPSRRSRGLVRGRPAGPWGEADPGRNLDPFRRFVSSAGGGMAWPRREWRGPATRRGSGRR